MKWKLGRQIRHPIHSSEKQFGYRRDLGTEEAIAEVRDIVRNTQESMVLALLFDITGAFDNLKWITILEQLNKRQCPRNLFLLVESYLTDRKVSVSNGQRKITKKIVKGCPQGSIVGPEF